MTSAIVWDDSVYPHLLANLLGVSDTQNCWSQSLTGEVMRFRHSSVFSRPTKETHGRELEPSYMVTFGKGTKKQIRGHDIPTLHHVHLGPDLKFRVR